MVLGAGAVLYWLVPPYHSFAFRSSGRNFRDLLLFLLMSAVIGALGELTRRQVAKRETAETALRESEARTRFSLEAANVGTWEWNMTTGNVRWSDNMERIHGQAPGSFAGNFESFLQGVHPADRENIPRLIQQAIGGGKYVCFTVSAEPMAPSDGWRERDRSSTTMPASPPHARGLH
jgi:PAS domain-containing protein